MGFVKEGGYVVLSGDRTLARKMAVDENTLNKVAEILGISKADRDKLISDIRSIYIYRGAKKSP